MAGRYKLSREASQKRRLRRWSRLGVIAWIASRRIEVVTLAERLVAHGGKNQPRRLATALASRPPSFGLVGTTPRKPAARIVAAERLSQRLESRPLKRVA